ncbi:hypothetical protein BB560_003168 [Smittium megazygosporum]|uniref:Uncharacterized protein n=1 Tax=Smittium megazygosporum TaxID=133381 RepID=A0A2T9ZCR0_9FUNG|nr:hypothetical protein BB560_003168 [Smittium megazygosporum]
MLPSIFRTLRTSRPLVCSKLGTEFASFSPGNRGLFTGADPNDSTSSTFPETSKDTEIQGNIRNSKKKKSPNSPKPEKDFLFPVGTIENQSNSRFSELRENINLQREIKQDFNQKNQLTNQDSKFISRSKYGLNNTTSSSRGDADFITSSSHSSGIKKGSLDNLILDFLESEGIDTSEYKNYIPEQNTAELKSVPPLEKISELMDDFLDEFSKSLPPIDPNRLELEKQSEQVFSGFLDDITKKDPPAETITDPKAVSLFNGELDPTALAKKIKESWTPTPKDSYKLPDFDSPIAYSCNEDLNKFETLNRFSSEIYLEDDSQSLSNNELMKYTDSLIKFTKQSNNENS